MDFPSFKPQSIGVCLNNGHQIKNNILRNHQSHWVFAPIFQRSKPYLRLVYPISRHFWMISIKIYDHHPTFLLGSSSPKLRRRGRLQPGGRVRPGPGGLRRLRRRNRRRKRGLHGADSEAAQRDVGTAAGALHHQSVPGWGKDVGIHR